MIKITVFLFANLREKAGKDRLEVEFSEEPTVGMLKNQLIEQYPALRAQFNKLLVSVNRELALETDRIPDGAEVAFMPPVSGGANYPTIIRLMEKELDLNTLCRQLTLNTSGAVCSFSGMVRGSTLRRNPHTTEALEYEATTGMAEEKMHTIASEIRERWREVQGIGIVHRIGHLTPGTTAVIVACSSSHRDSGIFEAARYGIERLKEMVPIWKKETGPDGDIWVEEIQ